MLSKKLFLFILSSIISTTPHSMAVTFDQSLIEKKALEIEKKLTQDRYLMYGLGALAVTYGIYQWMPLIMHMATKKSVEVSEKKDEVADTSGQKEEKPIDNRPLSQKFTDGMSSFASGTRDFFLNKQMWISMFQYSLSVSGANIISQISEQFIHPDTLRWYINAHAPYQQTIALMKDTIKKDDEAGCGDTLSLLHGCLVRQAMLMCAYMTYKIKHLDDAQKIIGERAKNSMLKMHQKWLTDIEVALLNNVLDESMLDAYQEAIVRHVDHCALIEGETKRERVAIKKKMR